MRPVLPGANRPHPNYIVNPVQDTLNELLQYAQEEAMVEAHIAYLIQVTSDNNWGADVSKIKKAKKSTFLSGFDTLEAIRDDIGRILVEPNDEANRIAKKLCFLEEMQRFYRLAREKAKSQIGVYSQAHDDLIKTLGYYCSYCGMPVGVSVHVEHKLPKVGYPTSAVIWDNLLLACQSCNSSKGEKPSRLTGAANATPPYVFSRPPLLAHLPAVVETQIAEGSRASYVWPDDPQFYLRSSVQF